ncbi:Carbon storage regulator [Maioricimonas rarisocia]|uniref:Translational regulator CsrA n=1 Tax=Maioricimonas rarisocia TaxID=2528026 RepID=A0A517Z859_9PLAN|nr:carbon storage regulator [Maioricimonas rarisocia]QDU38645.1 Carbon storage regulator [Maioricimonas rarisocia]
MLVLTRKEGEEIVIGNDIRVRVLRVRGGQIRVGIDAPREVRIIRSELAPAPDAHEAASEPQTTAAPVTAVSSTTFQAAATPHGVACR